MVTKNCWFLGDCQIWRKNWANWAWWNRNNALTQHLYWFERNQKTDAKFQQNLQNYVYHRRFLMTSLHALLVIWVKKKWKEKFDIKSRTGRPGGSDCYIWVWEKDIAVLTEAVNDIKQKRTTPRIWLDNINLRDKWLIN